MQSTLLTVIFTNPTATLLYYRSRLVFATVNRFRCGNNVGKSALVADCRQRVGARCEMSVCWRDKAWLSLSLAVSVGPVAACHSAPFLRGVQ